MKLVVEDFDAGLGLARTITDPWYRCQGLSAAAEVAKTEGLVRQLLKEAFGAAAKGVEPNRIVAVSSWPLRILARIGPPDEVERELSRLHEVILKEPHPVRRADALCSIAWSLSEASQKHFLRALDLFLEAALESHGWKRNRNLKDMAVRLTSMGLHDRAKQCVEGIELPKVRRQALREMEKISKKA